MSLRNQNDLIIQSNYKSLRSVDDLIFDFSTGQVVIISPEDNQPDFLEGGLYEWGYSGDETMFRVEVATDNTFSNIVQSDDVGAKELTSTVPVGTDYYIRITALSSVAPTLANEVTGISISSGSTIEQNGTAVFTITVSGTGSYNTGYSASGTGLTFSIAGDELSVTDVSGTIGNTKSFTVTADGDNSITASRTLTIQDPNAYQPNNSKEDDESALQEFVSTTDISLSGWSNTMTLEDDIAGVTVATRNGELRVTEIDIIGEGITGTIPESWADFQECEKLHFKQNNLSGSLPSKLGVGGKLVELSISGKSTVIYDYENEDNIVSNVKDGPLDNNSFTQGDLPETIYNNTGLKYFEIDGTDITSTLSTKIGDLTDLVLFYGSGREWDNRSAGFTFIGDLPSEIQNCTKLKWVHLIQNDLEADVSALFNSCTQLIDLKLDNNPSLTGSIPNPQGSKATFRAFGIDDTGIGDGEPYPDYYNDPDWARLLTFNLGGVLFNTEPEYNLMAECNNYNISGPVTGNPIGNPVSGELFKGIDPDTGLTNLFENSKGQKDIKLFYILRFPNLTGTFPHGDWGAWYNLRFIRIQDCPGMTGTLPPICPATSNTDDGGFMGCYFFNGSLTGSIPSTYGRLGEGNNPRAYFIETADAADSAWASGVDYAPPTIVSYEGTNYQVINYHTSQLGDEPPNTLDDGSARPFRVFTVSGNNMSGAIPEELKNINFKYIPNGPFKTGILNISENNFVFADIVPSLSAILARYEPINAEYIYYPQQKFGESSDYNSSTGVIDFSSRVTHVDNQYQWYDGDTLLTGETTAVLDTSGLGSGAYRLVVDNTGAPLLTLESITIYT